MEPQMWKPALVCEVFNRTATQTWRVTSDKETETTLEYFCSLGRLHLLLPPHDPCCLYWLCMWHRNVVVWLWGEACVFKEKHLYVFLPLRACSLLMGKRNLVHKIINARPSLWHICPGESHGHIHSVPSWLRKLFICEKSTVQKSFIVPQLHWNTLFPLPLQ